jgi:hypothetical protein
VYNVTTHKYERIFDQHFFLNVATLLGIPHVPIVEKCFVNPDLYKKYSTGIETLDYGKGPVPFEGVVVNYDDGSFKIINKHYDANKTEQISGE